MENGSGTIAPNGLAPWDGGIPSRLAQPNRRVSTHAGLDWHHAETPAAALVRHAGLRFPLFVRASYLPDLRPDWVVVAVKQPAGRLGDPVPGTAEPPRAEI